MSTDQKRKEPAFNMNDFKEIIGNIKSGNKAIKSEEIKKLLLLGGLVNHHQDKKTRRRVLAICEEFEYPHEHHTAKKLTAENYDVILVPHGYFQRHEKKFDVFLCQGHILLESDLKCITTTNVDTIGNRIKEGSEQAPRIVLDITSSIKKHDLIDGMRLGCQRNRELIELMLFFNSRFYRLFKTQIMGKNIYDIIQ